MCRSVAIANDPEPAFWGGLGHAVRVTSRRHLTLSEATSALRRGRQVEQYLGVDNGPDGRPVVRWVAVGEAHRVFRLTLHEVEDVGSDDFLDVSEFPPIAEDEEVGEGQVIGTSEEADAALHLAESLGAAPDRWVNQGVVQDEYRDGRRQSG